MCCNHDPSGGRGHAHRYLGCANKLSAHKPSSTPMCFFCVANSSPGVGGKASAANFVTILWFDTEAHIEDTRCGHNLTGIWFSVSSAFKMKWLFFAAALMIALGTLVDGGVWGGGKFKDFTNFGTQLGRPLGEGQR